MRRGGRGCRPEALARDPRRSVRDLGVQAVGGVMACSEPRDPVARRDLLRPVLPHLYSRRTRAALLVPCCVCRASEHRGLGGIAPPHRCGPGAVQLAAWKAFSAGPEQGGSAAKEENPLGTKTLAAHVA